MNLTDPTLPASCPKVVIDHLSAWFGATPALQAISLNIYPFERLAIIGPAGSGKSTLLRCLNRLNDLTPGFRSQGQVFLDGQELLTSPVDVAQLRRKIALVNTDPTPLPGTVFDNIAIALKMAGVRAPAQIDERVETGLRNVFLWDEVKDRLHDPALHLTNEKRKRLSLARALALEPEILLLDEPCASLDNVSATRFEDSLEELKQRYTIVMATNDIKQAARASDKTAFFLKGELVEWNSTRKFFTQPDQRRSHAFITERF